VVYVLFLYLLPSFLPYSTLTPLFVRLIIIPLPPPSYLSFTLKQYM
jgi:hypothetical protein